MTRARGKPFQRGKSGNPGGRPKALVHVQELARAKTENAFATLLAIAEDTAASASARVSAAIAILDRGWGRAPQPLTDADGESPRVMTFCWLPEQGAHPQTEEN